jgi:hypothetical protein
MSEPHGKIHQFMCEDHARLDVLLAQARAGEAIALPPYELFRSGLLKHIGLEEKILLPAAREARGGEPLPIAKQLRTDHSALAALMVPTPTHDILALLSELLARHNPLEETDGGMYDQVDALTASGADALLARLRAAPEVPVAPHVDNERVQRHVAQLFESTRRR